MTAVTRNARRVTKAAPRATFQEPNVPTSRTLVRTAKPPVSTSQPQVEQPTEPEPGRPTEHNGIAVVEETKRASPVAHGHFFRVTKLALEDGTTAYGCLDCLFTADVRNDVHKHRNAEHGASFGKRPPKVQFPKDDQLDDLVLSPRVDGSPAPVDIMQMTMAEVLALMPTVGAIGEYVSRLEDERDQLVRLARELKDEIKTNAHAVAVYPSLQDQVVDLRMRMKGIGSFDDMKAELLALRDWKKKLIKRLEPLGLILSEEGEQ